MCEGGVGVRGRVGYVIAVIAVMGCVRGESRICDSGGGDVGCVRGESRICDGGGGVGCVRGESRICDGGGDVGV